jgi:CheY-like chemotaxis protein
MALSRAGHTVVTVAYGERLDDTLEEFLPDLILVEIGLFYTLVYGTRAIETVRADERMGNIPIIAFSSDFDTKTAETLALEAGANEFRECNSLDISELLAIVDRYIESHPSKEETPGSLAEKSPTIDEVPRIRQETEEFSSIFGGSLIVRVHLHTLPWSHITTANIPLAHSAGWLRGAAAAGWPLPLALAHDLALLLSQPASQLKIAKPTHLPFDEDTSVYLSFLQRIAASPLIRELPTWQPPLSEAVLNIVLARLVEGLKLPDNYCLPAGSAGVIFIRELAAQLEQISPAQLWQDTPAEARPQWAKFLTPETLARIESNLNRLNRDELRFLVRYGPSSGWHP